MTRRRGVRDPRLVLRSVLVGGRGGVPGGPLGGPGDGDREAALTCGRVSAWQLRPNSRSVGPAARTGATVSVRPRLWGSPTCCCACCRHRFDRQSPQWPLVGIFAQRGKGRPGRLGLSVCRLLAVDELTVTVQALDAIDGAPVLDLKPYMSEFAPRSRLTQPAWSRELMAGCWDASSATGPCLPDMTKETTSLLTRGSRGAGSRD